MSRKSRFAQAAAVRARLIAMGGGLCKRCGYIGIALTFHHRDPRLKRFNLSGLNLVRIPWPRVLDEFSKCDVVCYNCHREINAEG